MIALLEEFSAVVSKETLMKLYKLGTEQAYSFLYINFMAKSPQEGMFYRSFETMLVPREKEQIDASSDHQEPQTGQRKDP